MGSLAVIRPDSGAPRAAIGRAPDPGDSAAGRGGQRSTPLASDEPAASGARPSEGLGGRGLGGPPALAYGVWSGQGGRFGSRV